jgi:hypothetical protein
MPAPGLESGLESARELSAAEQGEEVRVETVDGANGWEWLSLLFEPMAVSRLQLQSAQEKALGEEQEEEVEEEVVEEAHGVYSCPGFEWFGGRQRTQRTQRTAQTLWVWVWVWIASSVWM